MLKIRNLSVFACVAVLLFAGSFAAAQELTKVLPVDDPPVHCSDCTAPLGDGIILDQPPNQSNGIFADANCDFCGGPQVLAEPFDTMAGVMETITIWGGCFPGNVCAPHNFTILVHSDNGGLPGGVVCSENMAGDCNSTGVVLFGVNEWECFLDIVDCNVGGGIKWLEIFDDSGPATDDWFWEVGDFDSVNGVQGQAFAFEAPGVSWNFDPGSNMATLITGTGGGGDGGDGGDGGVPATTGTGVMLMVLALLGTSALFLRRRATNN